ncbi:hypothetical protein BDW59DRAFT_157912 [Aspergillus cavernicola]|uniref:Uncharacterized protein n=1 Tax=Aspergillus cavernicola TaxID=176166 RepID=A0ABR4IUR4_9EURO
MADCEYPLNLCIDCLNLYCELISRIPDEDIDYNPTCIPWIFEREFALEGLIPEYDLIHDIANTLKERLFHYFKYRVRVYEAMISTGTKVVVYFMMELPNSLLDVDDELQGFLFHDFGVSVEGWKGRDTYLHPCKRRLQFLKGRLFPEKWNLYDE